MKKAIVVIFACLILGSLQPNLSTSAVQRLTDEEIVNIDVYQKITPSVVSIEADIPAGVSIGTGFVVDKSGLILTSSHVIENARNIEVMTASGILYKGIKITNINRENDLALIKIEPKEDLIVLKMGNFDEVKVGQKVLAIGNPFGFHGTLTTGIVSRIDYIKNKLQTDAAINPGCSGGPIVNSKGEVIAISQSIYNPDNNQSNIGIGFAVPISEAIQFINLAKMGKKF